MTDRYSGKPMLKLLEAWVLDELGKLSSTANAQLVALEPSLRTALRAKGGWKQMITASLQLTGEHAAEVHRQWAIWLKDKPGQTAEQFAREFADALTGG